MSRAKGMVDEAGAPCRPSDGVLHVAWEALEKVERPSPKRAYVTRTPLVLYVARAVDSGLGPVGPVKSLLLEASGACYEPGRREFMSDLSAITLPPPTLPRARRA